MSKDDQGWRLFFLRHCVFPVLLALYPEHLVLPRYAAMPKKVIFVDSSCASLYCVLADHTGDFYGVRKQTASFNASSRWRGIILVDKFIGILKTRNGSNR